MTLASMLLKNFKIPAKFYSANLLTVKCYPLELKINIKTHLFASLFFSFTPVGDSPWEKSAKSNLLMPEIAVNSARGRAGQIPGRRYLIQIEPVSLKKARKI